MIFKGILDSKVGDLVYYPGMKSEISCSSGIVGRVIKIIDNFYISANTIETQYSVCWDTVRTKKGNGDIQEVFVSDLKGEWDRVFIINEETKDKDILVINLKYL